MDIVPEHSPRLNDEQGTSNNLNDSKITIWSASDVGLNKSNFGITYCTTDERNKGDLQNVLYKTSPSGSIGITVAAMYSHTESHAVAVFARNFVAGAKNAPRKSFRKYSTPAIKQERYGVN
jgi:hypothetical protein